MGYLIAGILSVIFVIIFLRALGGGNHGSPPASGTAPTTTSVTPNQPAADTPTPAKSTTATSAQKDNALHHTPPA